MSLNRKDRNCINYGTKLNDRVYLPITPFIYVLVAIKNFAESHEGGIQMNLRDLLKTLKNTLLNLYYDIEPLFSQIKLKRINLTLPDFHSNDRRSHRPEDMAEYLRTPVIIFSTCLMLSEILGFVSFARSEADVVRENNRRAQNARIEIPSAESPIEGIQNSHSILDGLGTIIFEKSVDAFIPWYIPKHY